MRYHNITKDDMLNGDGLRVVLWVAGCEHHCKECQNPITWDHAGGIPFDESAKKELFDELDKPYVTGITLSGGDPLSTINREEIGKLIEEIAHKYKDKNIWVYTGYMFDDVKNLPCMKFVDVLVDGKFVQDLFDKKLKWKGSSNQRVIDVKKSLGKELCLHCGDY